VLLGLAVPVLAEVIVPDELTGGPHAPRGILLACSAARLRSAAWGWSSELHQAASSWR